MKYMQLARSLFPYWNVFSKTNVHCQTKTKYIAFYYFPINVIILGYLDYLMTMMTIIQTRIEIKTEEAWIFLSCLWHHGRQNMFNEDMNSLSAFIGIKWGKLRQQSELHRFLI